jgi:hypothetical protein
MWRRIGSAVGATGHVRACGTTTPPVQVAYKASWPEIGDDAAQFGEMPT